MSANKIEALLNRDRETHLIQKKNDMASVSEEILWKACARTESGKKRVQYSDVDLENVENGSRRSRRRSSDHDFHGSSTCVLERVEKVLAGLDPEYPCFIKLMSHSYIMNGKLNLPGEFCKQYLPNPNESMILVSENGEEHTVKFIESRLKSSSTFSAGWPKFARENDLQYGDGLIFQLVSQSKFKVYIVKQDMNLIANAKQSSHEKSESSLELIELHNSDKSENVRNDPHTKSMDCFNNATTFVDYYSFTITVKGCDIDSELSENIRKKYYELCLSRKLYLHERLLETIKPKLAVDLISETVEIVDAIRSSGIFTSQEKFEVWDKTLQGFESLGMEVGFLRSRINQLIQKKQVLEFEINNKIDNLKAKYDLMFQEEARAGW